MTEQEIINLFPSLQDDPTFRITSPQDRNYNCAAWALFYVDKWVEPPATFVRLDGVTMYWPPNIPKTYNINSYIQLYQSKGYEACNSASYEENYRKIALYKDNDDDFTHVSRQKEDGSWTSKLGQENDIKHCNPDVLEGRYGVIAVIMKKPIGPLSNNKQPVRKKKKNKKR